MFVSINKNKTCCVFSLDIRRSDITALSNAEKAPCAAKCKFNTYDFLSRQKH